MLRLPIKFGNVIFHFTVSGIPVHCPSQYQASADEFCRRSQVSSFSFAFCYRQWRHFHLPRCCRILRSLTTPDLFKSALLTIF